MPATKSAQIETPNEKLDKSSRVSQKDIPRYSLDQALTVAKALIDEYAGGPVTPLKLAMALKLSPTSSSFQMLCGASIAYGLTSGGYNATEIKIEMLAKKILVPRTEKDETEGRREAFLKPRVVGEFLKKYNGASIPREDIAINVLSEEFQVPKDRCKDTFSSMVQTGEKLGLISSLKDKKYVDLAGQQVAGNTIENEDDQVHHVDEVQETLDELPPVISKIQSILPNLDSEKLRRVFITHGKNQTFLPTLKKLLQFGELTPVVAVEKQSASVPVPDKVMNDMRSCSAAIIHVDAEEIILDDKANERVFLNPNVLIEIGAAIALYGRRFILLVKEGVKLPSNLQGLYEVRYPGESLDGDATVRIMEAINEMKKQPALNS